mgnify:FL=1
MIFTPWSYVYGSAILILVSMIPFSSLTSVHPDLSPYVLPIQLGIFCISLIPYIRFRLGEGWVSPGSVPSELKIVEIASSKIASGVWVLVPTLTAPLHDGTMFSTPIWIVMLFGFIWSMEFRNYRKRQRQEESKWFWEHCLDPIKEDTTPLYPNADDPDFLFDETRGEDPESGEEDDYDVIDFQSMDRPSKRDWLEKKGLLIARMTADDRSDLELVRIAVRNNRGAYDFCYTHEVRSDSEIKSLAFDDLDEFRNLSYPKIFPNSHDAHNESFHFVDALLGYAQSSGGFDFQNAPPGYSSEFFLNQVSVVCLDMRVFGRDELTPELEKLFDKRKKTSGELVVVEKLFRFYFPFIRHGDLNQQPFYKILYWGLVETDSDPSKDPVTVEEMIPGYSHWYDRRTKSAYPSTDKKFFARMCFDLNQ